MGGTEIPLIISAADAGAGAGDGLGAGAGVGDGLGRGEGAGVGILGELSEEAEESFPLPPPHPANTAALISAAKFHLFVSICSSSTSS
ncbi:MAG TPA: hypothetical protein PK034_10520 [Rugosibacter sp.]|nr:hypothetical protein [Rugosibacter sp.]